MPQERRLRIPAIVISRLPHAHGSQPQQLFSAAMTDNLRW